jgi:hypothetical protein
VAKGRLVGCYLGSAAGSWDGHLASSDGVLHIHTAHACVAATITSSVPLHPALVRKTSCGGFDAMSKLCPRTAPAAGPPRSPSLPHSPMGSPVSPGNMRAPSPHLSPLPAPALMSAGYHQGAGSSPLSGASFAGWAGPQQQQPGSGSSGGGAAEGGPGEAAARTPSAGRVPR